MRRDVFQAIADPTRRAIILLVAFQAMTPNGQTKAIRQRNLLPNKCKKNERNRSLARPISQDLGEPI